MTSKFKVVIASNPDKERVVFEIYYGPDQFAEISNEDGENMRIEIYPPSSVDYWDFDLQELQDLLIKAKDNLE